MEQEAHNFINMEDARQSTAVTPLKTDFRDFENPFQSVIDMNTSKTGFTLPPPRSFNHTKGSSPVDSQIEYEEMPKPFESDQKLGSKKYNQALLEHHEAVKKLLQQQKNDLDRIQVDPKSPDTLQKRPILSEMVKQNPAHKFLNRDYLNYGQIKKAGLPKSEADYKIEREISRQLDQIDKDSDPGEYAALSKIALGNDYKPFTSKDHTPFLQSRQNSPRDDSDRNDSEDGKETGKNGRQTVMRGAVTSYEGGEGLMERPVAIGYDGSGSVQSSASAGSMRNAVTAYDGGANYRAKTVYEDPMATIMQEGSRRQNVGSKDKSSRSKDTGSSDREHGHLHDAYPFTNYFETTEFRYKASLWKRGIKPKLDKKGRIIIDKALLEADRLAGGNLSASIASSAVGRYPAANKFESIKGGKTPREEEVIRHLMRNAQANVDKEMANQLQRQNQLAEQLQATTLLGAGPKPPELISNRKVNLFKPLPRRPLPYKTYENELLRNERIKIDLSKINTLKDRGTGLQPIEKTLKQIDPNATPFSDAMRREKLKKEGDPEEVDDEDDEPPEMYVDPKDGQLKKKPKQKLGGLQALLKSNEKVVNNIGKDATNYINDKVYENILQFRKNLEHYNENLMNSPRLITQQQQMYIHEQMQAEQDRNLRISGLHEKSFNQNNITMLNKVISAEELDSIKGNLEEHQEMVCYNTQANTVSYIRDRNSGEYVPGSTMISPRMDNTNVNSAQPGSVVHRNSTSIVPGSGVDPGSGVGPGPYGKLSGVMSRTSQSQERNTLARAMQAARPTTHGDTNRETCGSFDSPPATARVVAQDIGGSTETYRGATIAPTAANSGLSIFADANNVTTPVSKNIASTTGILNAVASGGVIMPQFSAPGMIQKGAVVASFSSGVGATALTAKGSPAIIAVGAKVGGATGAPIERTSDSLPQSVPASAGRSLGKMAAKYLEDIGKSPDDAAVARPPGPHPMTLGLDAHYKFGTTYALRSSSAKAWQSSDQLGMRNSAAETEKRASANRVSGVHRMSGVQDDGTQIDGWDKVAGMMTGQGLANGDVIEREPSQYVQAGQGEDVDLGNGISNNVGRERGSAYESYSTHTGNAMAMARLAPQQLLGIPKLDVKNLGQFEAAKTNWLLKRNAEEQELRRAKKIAEDREKMKLNPEEDTSDDDQKTLFNSPSHTGMLSHLGKGMAQRELEDHSERVGIGVGSNQQGSSGSFGVLKIPPGNKYIAPMAISNYIAMPPELDTDLSLLNKICQQNNGRQLSPPRIDHLQAQTLNMLRKVDKNSACSLSNKGKDGSINQVFNDMYVDKFSESRNHLAIPNFPLDLGATGGLSPGLQFPTLENRVLLGNSTTSSPRVLTNTNTSPRSARGKGPTTGIISANDLAPPQLVSESKNSKGSNGTTMTYGLSPNGYAKNTQLPKNLGLPKPIPNWQPNTAADHLGTTSPNNQIKATVDQVLSSMSQAGGGLEGLIQQAYATVNMQQQREIQIAEILGCSPRQVRGLGEGLQQSMLDRIKNSFPNAPQFANVGGLGGVRELSPKKVQLLSEVLREKVTELVLTNLKDLKLLSKDAGGEEDPYVEAEYVNLKGQKALIISPSNANMKNNNEDGSPNQAMKSAKRIKDLKLKFGNRISGITQSVHLIPLPENPYYYTGNQTSYEGGMADYVHYHHPKSIIMSPMIDRQSINSRGSTLWFGPGDSSRLSHENVSVRDGRQSRAERGRKSYWDIEYSGVEPGPAVSEQDPWFGNSQMVFSNIPSDEIQDFRPSQGIDGNQIFESMTRGSLLMAKEGFAIANDAPVERPILLEAPKLLKLGTNVDAWKSVQDSSLQPPGRIRPSASAAEQDDNGGGRVSGMDQALLVPGGLVPGGVDDPSLLIKVAKKVAKLPALPDSEQVYLLKEYIVMTTAAADLQLEAMNSVYGMETFTRLFFLNVGIFCIDNIFFSMFPIRDFITALNVEWQVLKTDPSISSSDMNKADFFMLKMHVAMEKLIGEMEELSNQLLLEGNSKEKGSVDPILLRKYHLISSSIDQLDARGCAYFLDTNQYKDHIALFSGLEKEEFLDKDLYQKMVNQTDALSKRKSGTRASAANNLAPGEDIITDHDLVGHLYRSPQIIKEITQSLDLLADATAGKDPEAFRHLLLVSSLLQKAEKEEIVIEASSAEASLSSDSSKKYVSGRKQIPFVNVKDVKTGAIFPLSQMLNDLQIEFDRKGINTNVRLNAESTDTGNNTGNNDARDSAVRDSAARDSAAQIPREEAEIHVYNTQVLQEILRSNMKDYAKKIAKLAEESDPQRTNPSLYRSMLLLGSALKEAELRGAELCDANIDEVTRFIEMLAAEELGVSVMNLRQPTPYVDQSSGDQGEPGGEDQGDIIYDDVGDDDGFIPKPQGVAKAGSKAGVKPKGVNGGKASPKGATAKKGVTAAPASPKGAGDGRAAVKKAGAPSAKKAGATSVVNLSTDESGITTISPGEDSGNTSGAGGAAIAPKKAAGVGKKAPPAKDGAGNGSKSVSPAKEGASAPARKSGAGAKPKATKAKGAPTGVTTSDSDTKIGPPTPGKPPPGKSGPPKATAKSGDGKAKAAKVAPKDGSVSDGTPKAKAAKAGPKDGSVSDGNPKARASKAGGVGKAGAAGAKAKSKSPNLFYVDGLKSFQVLEDSVSEEDFQSKGISPMQRELLDQHIDLLQSQIAEKCIPISPTNRNGQNLEDLVAKLKSQVEDWRCNVENGDSALDFMERSIVSGYLASVSSERLAGIADSSSRLAGVVNDIVVNYKQESLTPSLPSARATSLERKIAMLPAEEVNMVNRTGVDVEEVVELEEEEEGGVDEYVELCQRAYSLEEDWVDQAQQSHESDEENASEKKRETEEDIDDQEAVERHRAFILELSKTDRLTQDHENLIYDYLLERRLMRERKYKAGQQQDGAFDSSDCNPLLGERNSGESNAILLNQNANNAEPVDRLRCKLKMVRENVREEAKQDVQELREELKLRGELRGDGFRKSSKSSDDNASFHTVRDQSPAVSQRREYATGDVTPTNLTTSPKPLQHKTSQQRLHDKRNASRSVSRSVTPRGGSTTPQMKPRTPRASPRFVSNRSPKRVSPRAQQRSEKSPGKSPRGNGRSPKVTASGRSPKVLQGRSPRVEQRSPMQTAGGRSPKVAGGKRSPNGRNRSPTNGTPLDMNRKLGLSHLANATNEGVSPRSPRSHKTGTGMVIPGIVGGDLPTFVIPDSPRTRIDDSHNTALVDLNASAVNSSVILGLETNHVLEQTSIVYNHSNNAISSQVNYVADPLARSSDLNDTIAPANAFKMSQPQPASAMQQTLLEVKEDKDSHWYQPSDGALYADILEKSSVSQMSLTRPEFNKPTIERMDSIDIMPGEESDMQDFLTYEIPKITIIPPPQRSPRDASTPRQKKTSPCQENTSPRSLRQEKTPPQSPRQEKTSPRSPRQEKISPRQASGSSRGNSPRGQQSPRNQSPKTSTNEHLMGQENPHADSFSVHRSVHSCGHVGYSQDERDVIVSPMNNPRRFSNDFSTPSVLNIQDVEPVDGNVTTSSLAALANATSENVGFKGEAEFHGEAEKNLNSAGAGGAHGQAQKQAQRQEMDKLTTSNPVVSAKQRRSMFQHQNSGVARRQTVIGMSSVAGVTEDILAKSSTNKVFRSWNSSTNPKSQASKVAWDHLKKHAKEIGKNARTGNRDHNGNKQEPGPTSTSLSVGDPSEKTFDDAPRIMVDDPDVVAVVDDQPARTDRLGSTTPKGDDLIVSEPTVLPATALTVPRLNLNRLSSGLSQAAIYGTIKNADRLDAQANSVQRFARSNDPLKHQIYTGPTPRTPPGGCVPEEESTSGITKGYEPTSGEANARAQQLKRSGENTTYSTSDIAKVFSDIDAVLEKSAFSAMNYGLSRKDTTSNLDETLATAVKDETVAEQNAEKQNVATDSGAGKVETRASTKGNSSLKHSLVSLNSRGSLMPSHSSLNPSTSSLLAAMKNAITPRTFQRKQKILTRSCKGKTNIESNDALLSAINTSVVQPLVQESTLQIPVSEEFIPEAVEESAPQTSQPVLQKTNENALERNLVDAPTVSNVDDKVTDGVPNMTVQKIKKEGKAAQNCTVRDDEEEENACQLHNEGKSQLQLVSSVDSFLCSSTEKGSAHCSRHCSFEKLPDVVQQPNEDVNDDNAQQIPEIIVTPILNGLNEVISFGESDYFIAENVSALKSEEASPEENAFTVKNEEAGIDTDGILAVDASEVSEKVGTEVSDNVITEKDTLISDISEALDKEEMISFNTKQEIISLEESVPHLEGQSFVPGLQNQKEEERKELALNETKSESMNPLSPRDLLPKI